MRTFTVKVPFEEGLHARPASELAKVCQVIDSEIVLTKDGREVNPKSILGIMTLGVTFGDEITFDVTGSDEDAAIESIEAFFK